MLEIVPAKSEVLVQHVVTLTHEYVTWMIETLQEHYPDVDLDEMRAGHDYDDIRKKFPGEHVPPFGRLYVAMSGMDAAGMIALGKLSDTVCEMRTLFVRPAFRGTGAGKKLVETVLDDARDIGYTHMRLDTLPFMDSALGLYHALGFQDIAPYRDLSDSLKQLIRFLELDLRQP